MGGESGTLTVTVPPLGENLLLVGRHYQKVYYGLRNTLRSRGMEGLPTFRHGNQLIVLPFIPIDHPYRHSLKSCEVPSRVWNDVQEITTPKLPHGNRQPYFEV